MEINNFAIQSYTILIVLISLHTCLHMNDLDYIVCNSYKVDLIYSITKVSIEIVLVVHNYVPTM